MKASDSATGQTLGSSAAHMAGCLCATCLAGLTTADDGTGGSASASASDASFSTSATPANPGFTATVTTATLQPEVAFIAGINANGTLSNPSYWTDNGITAHKWGAPAAGTSATVTFSFDPSAGYSSTEMATVLEALSLWSAVSNITFVAAAGSSTGSLVFTKNSSGSAGTDVSTAGGRGGTLATATSATVSIDTSAYGFDLSGSFTTVAGYGVQTIVHELGHVLGLGHAGNYNGNVNSATQQYSQFDTRLWSIMSYILPTDSAAKDYSSYTVNGTDWNGASNSTTMMIADIIAAQELYGAPTSGPLSGGQIFGFNTNVAASIRSFFDFTVNVAPIITLYDSGTGNTLDLSGYSNTEIVDLRAGHFSSFAGMTNNLGIAFGTKIDTAVGGTGTNFFYTNGDGDTITGGSGSDTVYFANTRASYNMTSSGGSITVSEGSEVNTLTNVETLVFSDQSITVACFCAGTPIRTARGEVAVEDLGIDDDVITLSGVAVPVACVMHRHIDAPGPHLMPVRVMAHSFGPHAPSRDLMLSPDHAVFVDGVLIPIRALVNGTSIAPVAVPEVTYFHVQLDRHNVIFAAGLACESYLASDDHDMFAASAPAGSVAADITPFAAIVTQGETVERVRRQMRELQTA